MIHKSVKQGHFNIIEDDVEIGEGTVIKDFCIIRSGARIGKNCVIGSYCEIRKNVKVGNGNSFGSRCTISENAIIGDGNTIKYGFVLTDTPNLTSKEKRVGAIGNGVLIGANVVLMPGFKLGDGCVIGACSQVRENVGENEVWYGSPAHKVKIR